MAQETIFSKIIRREVPAKIVYQDDLVTAFHDINPQAPVHILIIPNEVIPTTNDVESSQASNLGTLFIVAAKLAKQFSISESGYRLIVNCNKDARQEVFHLHMHLLGGKDLGPMLSLD
ncbi:MAG: HIT domain-containing protein [SAR324 cluster bacterium]|nr:HIT domain-containing protein [SAR324 cluster bacterium]